MAKKITKLPAAQCANCSTVFEFEQRDKFSGEIFCPVCMSRVSAKSQYTDLKAARVDNKTAPIYAEA